MFRFYFRKYVDAGYEHGLNLHQLEANCKMYMCRCWEDNCCHDGTC